MSSLVIAIFLLSIGASFVQQTTGFGFGIFIMTMLPFFLPTYGEATTLSGLLAEQKKMYTEDDLMKKIGRLEVENDFLRSVSLALGLNIEKPK